MARDGTGRLRIRTFGGLSIEHDGEVIDSFASRKAEALLVYLACNPRSHPREVLAELLWDDRTQRQAMANLRVVLSSLRKEVGGYVEITRTTAALEEEADVWLDARVLETGVAAESPGGDFDSEGIGESLALYEGDFLAGFFLRDASGFEKWAGGERERLHRVAVEGLRRLGRWHLEQGQYAAAVAVATQQVEVAPLAETGHRQLMVALARKGQRAQALAQYEVCQGMLAEELGMDPAARTTELYDRILAGELDMDSAPSHDVRGYDLKELIAEGGHGAVHRAVQRAIGREVVVKVIRRKYADDPDFIRRFEAEAQIVARLEHPHIVPLYDCWRDPGGAYLVMRYMRQGSLLTALKSGPWPPERAATLLNQIAGALSAAHQKGIVHRDLKPGNILLDEAGNAYLTDFGIAKDLTGQEQLTAEDGFVGTLDYTPPEQILRGEATPQSDIYSLGAVIYETLTGAKPFAEDSVARVLHNQLNKPMPPVSASRGDIPAEVDTVLQKATAKEVAERYASAQEMAGAFSAAIGSPAIERGYETAELLPEVADIYNPYKGLRAFQEADAADFFGRDNLVRQLVDRLGDSASRFLAIVGPSGSGKSSVVKAGLIPALRSGALPGSENWFTAEMVPGTHPLEELELALWPVAVDPPPSLVEPMQRDSRGMLRTLRRILPGEDGSRPQLLLIIDQFEELFTLVDDQERREFFLDSLLTALTAPRSPLRVVITLRADFYDRPLLHQEWGQIIKDNTEVVLPLNHSELTRAIREPASRMGVRLQEDLVTAIVGDVADQLGALPLLQYALTELFERREGKRITEDAYQEIGGVQGALGGRAEEIYESLDENGREAARQLFLRLVTLGEGIEDTRRRVLRSELLALGIGKQTVVEGHQPTANRQQLTATNLPMTRAIDSFGAARLLTFDHDPVTRGGTVEVAHEALLREWGRLREWLHESRAEIHLQQQLARAAVEWEHAGRDPGFLIPGGTRLEQFEAWRRATDLALTPQEVAYLEASLEAEEERQAHDARQTRARRNLQRALMGVLSLGLMVAVGLSIFAFSRQRVAEAARREAEASEQEALRQASIGLAAQAIAQLDSYTPERGVLLALEALKEYPYTPQAESALAQAVYRTHAYMTLRTLDELRGAIEFSPDGAFIAAGDAVWDSTSGEMVAEFSMVDTSVNNLSLDWFPDNRRLLATRPENGGLVSVRDAIAGEERWRHRFGMVNTAYASADGRRALSARADGTAFIWRIENGKIVQRFWHGARVDDAVWSPDEDQVATAADDGTIRLWDVETGDELKRINAHPDGVTALSWSADGARLASAGKDGLGRVWQTATGELLFTLIGHDALVLDIEWSPDDSLLATVGGDGMVRVWDGRAGFEQFALPSSDSTARDVSWSPDGQRLAVSGEVLPRVWDVSTPIVRLVGYSPTVDPSAGIVRAAQLGVGTILPYWSPDSSWIGALGISDHAYRLWDPLTGENIRTFDPVVAGVAHPNPAGTEIILSNPVRIVDLETDRSRRFPLPWAWWDSYFEWSPDGSLINVQPARRSQYRIYDAETLELLYEGERRACGHFLAGTFSPDGAYLAHTCLWSDEYTSVRIVEALTGRIVQELEGHTDWAFVASWSPDGTKLATTSNDLTVRVWDVESGETLTVFTGQTPANYGLDWSPDGTRLVSADPTGTVLILDVESGGIVNRYNVGGYAEVNWSPDGSRVLTAGHFPAPDIRPVWQSTEELIAYAYECCVFRELTPAEREQFGLAPTEDGMVDSMRYGRIHQSMGYESRRGSE